jgi:hypothetical protein
MRYRERADSPRTEGKPSSLLCVHVRSGTRFANVGHVHFHVNDSCVSAQVQSKAYGHMRGHAQHTHVFSNVMITSRMRAQMLTHACIQGEPEPRSRGIIPRATEEIFGHIENAVSERKKFLVR